MIQEPILFTVPSFISLTSLEDVFKMHIPGDFSTEEQDLVRMLLKNNKTPFNETFIMPDDLRLEVLMKYREVCYKALHSDGVVGVLLVFSEEGTLEDINIQT